MKIGRIDLDTRFEYLIVYKDGDTINTWTLEKYATIVNYHLMKQREGVEILAVYRKLNVNEILDMM